MGRAGEFHFAEFMAGMAERLVTRGYRHSGYSDGRSRRRQRDAALSAAGGEPASRCDHHAFAAARTTRVSRCLHALGMPFLVHGRSDIDVPHAWLDIDNEGAVRRATAHLLDLGHSRIAMINGRPGATYALHRDAGYRSALAEPWDRGSIPQLIASGNFTDELGFRFARSFLERGDAADRDCRGVDDDGARRLPRGALARDCRLAVMSRSSPMTTCFPTSDG
jgi:LacI family transcriptional regulator